MDVDGGDAERRSAVDALKESCRTLSDQCDFVVGALEEALPEVREDRERMEELQQAGAAEEDYDEEDDEDDD